VKVDTEMRAPMPGALNSMSPRAVRRHMSVFGGVEIVKGLVVSEGTVELDALIASQLRDMLGGLCCFSVRLRVKVETWLITYSSVGWQDALYQVLRGQLALHSQELYTPFG